SEWRRSLRAARRGNVPSYEGLRGAWPPARTRSPDVPPLQAPVADHEQHRDDEGEKKREVATEEEVRDEPSPERADDADPHRHPDRHRVGPRHGEARQTPDDQAGQREHEDEEQHGYAAVWLS